MKKSLLGLLFITFFTFFSYSQTKDWEFSRPEWDAYSYVEEHVVVDGLNVMGAIVSPIGIIQETKTFFNRNYGVHTFNRALKFFHLPVTSGGSEIPTTGAIAFNIDGPGIIRIICLSSDNEPKNLQITNGIDFSRTISAEANTFKDQDGSELPLTELNYEGDSGMVYVYALSPAINLFYLEVDVAGDSIHTEPVTFNVKVPDVTNECWITGSFNGWNTSAHQMHKVDDVNYTLTVPNVDMSALEYKYTSGPNWAYVEKDADGEEVPNRTYQSNDTVYNWLSVYEPDSRNVTYTVKVPSGTNQVCIVGDFNNWSPGTHWMNQLDSVTFTLTVQGANTGMKYKYLNGPDWSFEEITHTGASVLNRNWSELDEVEAWANMFVPDETRIFYDNIHTSVGEDITIEIRMSSTQPRQAIAYQFELNFDANTLHYIGYTTQGTVAATGEVVVNSTKDVGTLYISFMSSESFDVVNSLIKLNFNVVNTYSHNQTSLWFNELYLDNQQLYNYHPGTIYIDYYMLGDVDGNLRVQAYDAALTLQYSVGKDPLPLIAPRPWEGWRLQAADVDGVPGITANDAALILQYSAYVITSFDTNGGEYGMIKAPNQRFADVEIVKDQHNLYFKSFGNLVGFNLFIEQELDAFGTPLISGDVMSAVNTEGDIYAVGLAAIEPLVDGATFLTIPLLREIPSDVQFRMYVNADEISRVAEAQTAVKSLSEAGITLYPNPVSNMLRLNNLTENSSIRIYDISGRIVWQKEVISSSERIDLSDLSGGIYTISIRNNSINAVSKFIKR